MKFKGNVKSKITALMLCIVLAVSVLVTGCSGDGDGNTQISDKEYGFIVMNQDGEVISGAQIEFADLSVSTGSNGSASFNRPEDENSGKLKITCTDYYDYEVDNYTLSDSGSDVIVLKSKSIASHHLKSAVYRNTDAAVTLDVDVLTKYKKVNQSTENLDFDIITSVLGDEDTVSKYELHQSVDGTDKVIATSTDGTFKNLKVKDFSVGTNIYVTVYDNSNHETSTALNFEIAENPNYQQYSEFSLGDGISFKVSDDIPIFGGTEFNLSLPAIPLEYSVSQDKIHIGFNVNEDTFDDEEQMKNYKKMITELHCVKSTTKDYKNLVNFLKENQKQKGLLNMSGFDRGVEISVGGYAEAGFDSYGKPSSGEGYLFITVTGSAKFNWEVVVWVVPVSIGIEGEIEAKLSEAISYSFDDNKFSGDVALTIKPGLKAKAGPGFEYLSAGVYGSAEVETKLILSSITEDPGFSYVDLTSSIGVYAKVAFFEPEKQLATGTFNLWTRKPKTSVSSVSEDENTQAMGGSISEYLYNLDNYVPVEQADAINTQIKSYDNKSVIADGISSGASPVSESNGDTALTVFTSQKDYDNADASYSKLYYSYFKNGSWTESSIITDSAVNEMNPKLYTDGKDYYLMYQESQFDSSLLNNYSEKTTEEKRELMKQAFLSFDMHVYKFNDETGVFEDLGSIKTDGVYDYNADFFVSDNTIYVYSAGNKEGDFFGTSENANNFINRFIYKDGVWQIEKVKDGAGSVTYLAAGIFNGTPACVYSEDTDNNLETTDDIKTFMYYNNVSTSIKDGAVSQITNTILPGDNQSGFVITDETGMYTVNEDMSLQKVLEDNANYAQKYVLSDNAVYETVQNDSSTEIYARYRLSDGNYSEPVQITSEDKWQKDLSVFTIDGKDYVMSLSEDYEDGNLSTQLVAYTVESYYDIEVEDVNISYEDTLTTNELPVEVTVKNNGNKFITGESVEINDAYGNNLSISETDYSKGLNPGETATFKLHVTTDDNTAYGTWKVKTSISAGEDSVQENIYEADSDNNYFEASTGFSDFNVEASVNDTGSYPFLMINVRNNGNVQDSADLVILDANDTSKELARYNISDLQTDKVDIFKANIKSDWADDNGKAAVIVKVINANQELYTYNNYTFAYATLNYGKYNISYELNGGTNSEMNPTEYTTADKVVFEQPYKDGYEFAGWYTSEDFNVVTKVTEIKAGTAGNITLYAKWKEIEQEEDDYLIGDVDNNGKVTLIDAQLVLKAALGIENFSDEKAAKAADADESGKVDLVDVTLILKAALGIISL